MVKLADEKQSSAAAAREGMEKGERIESWFSTVYHRGYLHGFFRALGYAQHHAKEGRLRRVRNLWENVLGAQSEPGAVWVKFTPEAYNEVSNLLKLRFGVKLDAEGSADAGAAG